VRCSPWAAGFTFGDRDDPRKSCSAVQTVIAPADPTAVQGREASARELRERRLARVIAENFDKAWLFARRLGVAEGDLDDVMQEVTAITFERLPEIGHTSEKSFVFGTTFRVASEYRRRRHRRREAPEELAVDFEDPHAPPDRMSEMREARVLLDRILESMTMELRSVFVLFEIDEYNQIEIAELLSLPVGTVASRLRRAREHFDSRVARWQASERRFP
jgi:RNA polymerase sigma-70 factor (ECF subfamily)